jgi:hypothetical protein
MGDRANVHVIENEKENGVYLYTHWCGTYLPLKLQEALATRWRWNDGQYLARIIFDVMTARTHGEETGYGISAHLGDGARRVLTVNIEKQTVSFEDKVWAFEEYLKIDAQKDVWECGQ